MKKILLLIIVGALVAAAVTNPSESKAKELINTEISERLKDTVGSYVTTDDDDSDSLGQIVSALTDLFAPSIVDLGTNIKIHNYFFFTTYEVNYVIDRQEADESGYILFGSLHRN